MGILQKQEIIMDQIRARRSGSGRSSISEHRLSTARSNSGHKETN